MPLSPPHVTRPVRRIGAGGALLLEHAGRIVDACLRMILASSLTVELPCQHCDLILVFLVNWTQQFVPQVHATDVCDKCASH